MNTFLTEVLNPLSQFQIRDLLYLDAPLIGNIHISITNIGFYLIVGLVFILIMNLFSTNRNRLVSNNWSISNETIYATIHSIVVNQINTKRGQGVFCPVGENPTLQIQRSRIILIIEKIVFSMKLNYALSNSNTIEGLSSTLNKAYPTNQQLRKYYSTSAIVQLAAAENILLNPWWLTGFVDGEGCFTVSIYKDSGKKTGWRVRLIFLIRLHVKDRALLERIKNYLRVGKVYNTSQYSEYRVESIKEIENINEHFDNFPLKTEKLTDYEHWRKAYYLVKNQEHLTIEGLHKIVAIRSSINLGLSPELKAAFPDVVPVERPLIQNKKIKDLNWLAGFTSGEGCFYVGFKKSKTHSIGFQVELRFILSQHFRDEQLMRSLIEYLECGKICKNRDVFDYRVNKFADLTEKIIPLFEKYPILGEKSKDFEDFSKVAKMMKEKQHLIEEGLEKIKKVKAGMNRGRKG